QIAESVKERLREHRQAERDDLALPHRSRVAVFVLVVVERRCVALAHVVGVVVVALDFVDAEVVTRNSDSHDATSRPARDGKPASLGSMKTSPSRLCALTAK